MKNEYSVSDMERIQKGLEEFLQQETEKKEPQLFDLRAEAESWEKETGRGAHLEQDNWDEPEADDMVAEDDIEDVDDIEEWEEEDDMADWDSKESRRREKEARRNRGTEQAAAMRKGTQQSAAQKTAAKGTQTAATAERKSASRQERGAAPQSEATKQLPKKNKRRKKSGFRRFLTMLLVLILLVAGGAYFVVGKLYDKMHYETIESVERENIKDDGVINILLIGNDSRTNGEDGRSDAMILLSINNKTKEMYMTSLLRDMYVEIPGYKGNRLNAAYAYGGAELLMETIELNFGINVNRYMLVNFEAFANLVDAVGGVELELSSEEVEYVNAYLWEYNVLTNRPEGTDYMDTSLSGMIHLNGPQALAYTRNRYMGTDFGRTERQRKVLGAIIKKAPKAMLTNSGELINGLLPNLTTNLTKNECYRLGFVGAQALGYEIIQGSIPLEGTYKNATIREMSVLEVDFEANKQYLQEVVYGKAE